MQFLVPKTMSPLQVTCGAKSALLLSMCVAKSALHRKFAPHIEGSNADFALHIKSPVIPPIAKKNHSISPKKITLVINVSVTTTDPFLPSTTCQL